MINTEFNIKEGYYYLHTNGNVIYKPMSVLFNTTAAEYFDSPFVIKYWYVKTKEGRAKMVKELKAMERGLNYKE